MLNLRNLATLVSKSLSHNFRILESLIDSVINVIGCMVISILIFPVANKLHINAFSVFKRFTIFRHESCAEIKIHIYISCSHKNNKILTYAGKVTN